MFGLFSSLVAGAMPNVRRLDWKEATSIHVNIHMCVNHTEYHIVTHDQFTYSNKRIHRKRPPGRSVWQYTHQVAQIVLSPNLEFFEHNSNYCFATALHRVCTNS